MIMITLMVVSHSLFNLAEVSDHRHVSYSVRDCLRDLKLLTDMGLCREYEVTENSDHEQRKIVISAYEDRITFTLLPHVEAVPRPVSVTIHSNACCDLENIFFCDSINNALTSELIN